MRKFTLFITTLFLSVGMAWAEVPFKVSNAPTDGVWDANTTWYFIQFPNSDSHHTGGYLAAEGNGFMSETNYNGKVSRGKLLITQTEKPMKYSALWCIVGDETNGYKFYNKMNPHLLLGMPTSGSEARMYNEEKADVCYAFAYAPSTSNKWKNECVTFKIPGGNKYWNNQDAGGNAADYLKTWDNSAAQGDNGSAVRLTEATEHDLAAMAATLPEEGHYYVIKSVRTGKYAAYTTDNTQLAQQDRNESSKAQMWYFTVDGDGYKLHNLATDKLFAGTSSFTDNGTTVYVKENPYCAGYVCVSTQENLSGNCWDEQGSGTKIGTWAPSADDFQGTSWILEEEERPLSEISYTITDALGNTFTGTYNGFAGETLPTITGGTFEGVNWSENSVTATISYTIENIGEEVTIEIHDAIHRLYVVGDDVKVAKEDYSSREGYTASNAVWVVYPSMTDGVVAYTIKHEATGKWVVAASTTGHNAQGKVTLTDAQDNATKFEVGTYGEKPCFKVLNQNLYLSINSDTDENVYLGLHGSTHYGTRLYFTETLAGAGTEASPYLINNVDDLILFRNSVNAGETKYSAPGVYVALGADIDLTGQNWVGIGSIAQPHGFMGNFDGKNFKIKNLTITDPAADSDGYVYAGLFSITEGTDQNNQNVIKNLTIENVTINTTGHIVSAAIAYPYCTIVDNVTVCGKIDITGGDYTAGALAYTRRCVNASNVTVAGTEGSTITGASVVGGVISDIQMNGGWIADYSNFSASGVSITGTEMVGGISGIIATQTLNGASVKNVTLASGDSRVGRISGAFGGTSTISNVVVENVTGATAIVGPTYKGANPVEAKIGDTYYSTLAEAVKATGNVELLTEVTLKDDVAYESKSSKQVNGTITYTRNLTAFWNPIYLPFAVTLSTEDYDVAEFTSAEGETLTLTKIKDATATLNANTAYVIRPKTDDAKTLTITLENATLEAATVNTKGLGTDFSVRGNYSVLKGENLKGNDRVVGTNGDWGVLKSTSTLKPFRLILTIPATAKAISMRVEGEDVTSIENLGITIEGDVIFDLMGRRVETMTEGGIYIVNGKKIVF